jgi:hypothetical protein
LADNDYFDDMYSFDLANMTSGWALLSATAHDGRPPSRFCHGFTSAGGKLYLHGGVNFAIGA